MKSVLCFGDSNTWGYIPGNGGRFSRYERWTGRLQQLLGEDYYIIEEGLNGRTTVWDDPVEEHKNGRRQLIPTLQSHKPLDLVILMLGTNDLKLRYHVPMIDIQISIMQLLTTIENHSTDPGGEPPQILLIAPPLVSGLSEFSSMFEGAEEKSRHFAKIYEEAAALHTCHFLDAALYVFPNSLDGVHLDVDNHRIFADVLCEKIQNLI